MILRRHRAGDCDSLAVYSGDERYRYRLSRRWAEGAEVLFVMLNPSTATELRNDPTIERCERRARRWGYAGFSIGNLFGYRATKPGDLKRADDPVGAGNDRLLVEMARGAGMTLCAWGVHGYHLGRGAEVADLLRAEGLALHHLGLTRAGAPRHPLYLPYAEAPRVWA